MEVKIWKKLLRYFTKCRSISLLKVRNILNNYVFMVSKISHVSVHMNNNAYMLELNILESTPLFVHLDSVYNDL